MKNVQRWAKAWLIAAAVSALAGCASLPAHIGTELAKPGIAAAPDPYAVNPAWRQTTAAVAGKTRFTGAPPPTSSLKSGQLLLWGKRDASALFVGLFAQTFRPWSHIGIVSVEADGVYVFETNSAFVSTSDGPPTESATGGMRHLPFKEHVAANYIFGVYDLPPGVDADKVVAYARKAYQRKARFDAFFDNREQGALYCSELIALAFEAAGAAPAPLAPVRQNRSYDVVRQWLHIQPTGFYLPADFIAPERQVALWSHDLSPAQIEALFAAQQELADRFGPSTSLGHLMQWNAMSTSMLTALSLRDGAQAFLDASVAALATDHDPRPDRLAIQRQIKALASGYFLRSSVQR